MQPLLTHLLPASTSGGVRVDGGLHNLYVSGERLIHSTLSKVSSDHYKIYEHDAGEESK